MKDSATTSLPKAAADTVSATAAAAPQILEELWN
jgi:hypothetical protein